MTIDRGMARFGFFASSPVVAIASKPTKAEENSLKIKRKQRIKETIETSGGAGHHSRESKGKETPFTGIFLELFRDFTLRDIPIVKIYFKTTGDYDEEHNQ